MLELVLYSFVHSNYEKTCTDYQEFSTIQVLALNQVLLRTHKEQQILVSADIKAWMRGYTQVHVTIQYKHESVKTQ